MTKWFIATKYKESSIPLYWDVTAVDGSVSDVRSVDNSAPDANVDDGSISGITASDGPVPYHTADDGSVLGVLADGDSTPDVTEEDESVPGVTADDGSVPDVTVEDGSASDASSRPGARAVKVVPEDTASDCAYTESRCVGTAPFRRSSGMGRDWSGWNKPIQNQVSGNWPNEERYTLGAYGHRSAASRSRRPQ